MQIELQCSKVVGEPIFVEETADCVHRFIWQTPVSCPSLVMEPGAEQWRLEFRFALHLKLN
jgi:hypothetical protein